MNIQLEELQRALDIIFKHLREQGTTSVEIEEDYYWNVPVEEVYNPTKPPVDLDLGQLTEDWTRLESIAKDKSSAIGYALAWAAPILRRIGERNVG